jgi:hypothetical protein
MNHGLLVGSNNQLLAPQSRRNFIFDKNSFIENKIHDVNLGVYTVRCINRSWALAHIKENQG